MSGVCEIPRRGLYKCLAISHYIDFTTLMMFHGACSHASCAQIEPRHQINSSAHIDAHMNSPHTHTWYVYIALYTCMKQLCSHPDVTYLHYAAGKYEAVRWSSLTICRFRHSFWLINVLYTEASKLCSSLRRFIYNSLKIVIKGNNWNKSIQSFVTNIMLVANDWIE